MMVGSHSTTYWRCVTANLRVFPPSVKSELCASATTRVMTSCH